MHINSNLSPTEAAAIHFPDYDIVQVWAQTTEAILCSDIDPGDIEAGFPEEDCLEADIITPLNNLTDSIKAGDRIPKKTLLEALAIIERSATNCQSRLVQSGEYARGDLATLEAAIDAIKKEAA